MQTATQWYGEDVTTNQVLTNFIYNYGCHGLVYNFAAI